MGNAVLAQVTSDTPTNAMGLRLANDVKRGYSKCPTAHARDMRADGISATAHLVYTAIADRQTHEDGECFRSNAGIAEELGIHKSSVSRCISALKSKGYLSVWFVNGGRRMRALTRVSRGVSTRVKGGTHQRIPDKVNNIKKTTQQRDVVFTDDEKGVFGGSNLEKLVTSYGLEKVRRGLLAFEGEDGRKIRNPIGWLTKAIKDDYEPRTAKQRGEKFSENAFDHHKIIQEYAKANKDNIETIEALKAKGVTEGQIAYKIWSGKI